jgi:hypothetical protein
VQGPDVKSQYCQKKKKKISYKILLFTIIYFFALMGIFFTGKQQSLFLSLVSQFFSILFAFFGHQVFLCTLDRPASKSPVLGLQACATMLG